MMSAELMMRIGVGGLVQKIGEHSAKRSEICRLPYENAVPYRGIFGVNGVCTITCATFVGFVLG